MAAARRGPRVREYDCEAELRIMPEHDQEVIAGDLPTETTDVRRPRTNPTSPSATGLLGIHTAK
ncbi:hypothetical protein [Streptomyces sp. SLBN-31]|uniref:hypothetical protein n=1 Tax=Streptomyces sp. SLBN-31 TaxID=2768444 RepID=UPI00114E4ACB|nr:hypothetical protein [Streptomyces sp. SLBN-31]